MRLGDGHPPGQDGETPSLLKIQKSAGRGGLGLKTQLHGLYKPQCFKEIKKKKREEEGSKMAA
ncbi:hypothetical protein AAY473_040499 [Plecturocebus cupreus]